MNKNIIKKLLYPNIFLIIILLIISIVSLFLIFNKKQEESVYAYIAYAISFYTLIVFILGLIKYINLIKKKYRNKTLFRSEFANKYLYNKLYRANLNIILTNLFNLLYCIFYILVGTYYKSIWFITIGIYYLILSLLKFYVIKQYKKNINNYKLYLFVSILLFILNLALAGIILLVILKNSSYKYNGYIIYVVAIYTFYMLILNIVNYFKYKRFNNNVITLYKTINIVISLVSIFTLQTAMITTFSDNDSFRIEMNTITGVLVWCLILIIGIYLLIKSQNNEKE